MNNLNLKNILLFSLITAFFSINTASPMHAARRGFPKKELAPFRPELPITLKQIFIFSYLGHLKVLETNNVIGNLERIINDERQPRYIKEECLRVLEDAFLKLSPATNEIRKSLEFAIQNARAKLAPR